MSLDLSKVDVVDMLTALGIRNVTEGSINATFSCPFPGHSFGDATPSANMHLEGTQYYCYACKSKGNAVTFLAKLEGVSPMLASRWLRERYCPDDGGSVSEIQARLERLNGPEQAVPTELAALPELLTDCQLEPEPWQILEIRRNLCYELEGWQRYPFDRGFDSETLESFGWVYDAQTDRVAFAVRDEDGRIVGYKARLWNDRKGPRYLALGDTPKTGKVRGYQPYRTGRILFNLDRAKRSGGRPMVVVEGELNAMMIRQVVRDIAFEAGVGEPPVVGLPGSVLSREQALLLRRHADAAVLWFDEDLAGWNGLWGDGEAPGAVAMLRDFMPVSVVGPHEGDACSLTPQAILSLINSAAPAPLLPPRDSLIGRR